VLIIGYGSTMTECDPTFIQRMARVVGDARPAVFRHSGDTRPQPADQRERRCVRGRIDVPHRTRQRFRRRLPGVKEKSGDREPQRADVLVADANTDAANVDLVLGALRTPVPPRPGCYPGGRGPIKSGESRGAREPAARTPPMSAVAWEAGGDRRRRRRRGRSACGYRYVSARAASRTQRPHRSNGAP
jgi:hypothetical protein